ncbi:hypothetical protein FWJ25_19425 [Marinobacter salinexigens]|uniref:Uncharacterized protein n=1 Tax=Marinobacter salinexigens TaxID=2919747 RepID=A0A5B0V3C7_9GAMM|nr:hypothetical protein FWJ25_19425 [Marinobacter salinexigens]
MTEVAPPQVVSVMRQRRKKVPRSLDTIAEDDREQQLACGPPSDHGFAAAWSLPTPTPTPPQPRERAGGFVARGLVGKYLSDAHDGCQASGWEGGHRRIFMV